MGGPSHERYARSCESLLILREAVVRGGCAPNCFWRRFDVFAAISIYAGATTDVPKCVNMVLVMTARRDRGARKASQRPEVDRSANRSQNHGKWRSCGYDAARKVKRAASAHRPPTLVASDLSSSSHTAEHSDRDGPSIPQASVIAPVPAPCVRRRR